MRSILPAPASSRSARACSRSTSTICGATIAPRRKPPKSPSWLTPRSCRRLGRQVRRRATDPDQGCARIRCNEKIGEASMAGERRIGDAFRRKFGAKPRIHRAPGGVNPIGEHTDYNDRPAPRGKVLSLIRSAPVIRMPPSSSFRRSPKSESTRRRGGGHLPNSATFVALHNSWRAAILFLTNCLDTTF